MSGVGTAICPICGTQDILAMRPYQARHSIFAGLHLMRCAECGMVFADPMPSQEQWDAYNRDFFAESESAAPNTGAIPFFKGVAQIRLDYISAEFGGTLPDSVVEIGPGPGYFCRAYKDRVPVVSYCAIETDLSCHDPLREIGVEVHADLAAVKQEGPGAGLVVMSHVLEHSQQPRDFIRSVLELLRPGGAMFIEIPCMDFEYKAVFDAHVLFFAKSPLERLLVDAGISRYRLSYHGEPIVVLKRQLSRGWRMVSRVREAAGRLWSSGARDAPAEESLLQDEDMWHHVAPFKPHVENKQPSRWLRAMAFKPE